MTVKEKVLLQAKHNDDNDDYTISCNHKAVHYFWLRFSSVQTALSPCYFITEHEGSYSGVWGRRANTCAKLFME